MQNPETLVIVVGTTKQGKVVLRAWLVACLSVAALGSADPAWAQPANDDCADAVTILNGTLVPIYDFVEADYFTLEGDQAATTALVMIARSGNK